MLPGHARLVPAHPVAGTEYSGPDAGFASLFVNRWCILTPPEGTDDEAVEKVRAFWETLGSHVEIMSAAHHDLVLAITSHVPHLIAYNIVGTAADLEEVTRSEVIKFSAGGFRDFTRIASSDPTMWRDVFLHNKDAVLEMLGRFNEDLTALQRMIRREDGDGLFALVHADAGDPARNCRPGSGNRGPGFRPSRRGNGRAGAVTPSDADARPLRTAAFWVFGYGSLMWRPGFAYARRCKALLRGWRRSLCVYSHVYRGSPERPGLVLGLDRGGACPGVAFEVDAALREPTIRYLREREQVTSVYLERVAPVTLEGGDRVLALTYVADRLHDQYAGRLDREAMLEYVRAGQGQVRRQCGICPRNQRSPAARSVCATAISNG